MQCRKNWIRFSGILFISTVWISSALFAIYILAFYGGTALSHTFSQWNRSLPRLYETRSTYATVSIGSHFLAGALLLLMGPLQFFSGIRLRYPVWHRWLGRIYVTAAFFAGFAGFFYVVAKGTVGGVPMDIGFGLYGGLMSLFAVQTIQSARRLDFGAHRAWGIRLFALVIGSWLYRMEYGFWSLATKERGIGQNFDGPFDLVMDFFFYIPNLVVAESFIRSRIHRLRPWVEVCASTGLLLGSVIVAMGTYYFTRYYWAPSVTKFIFGHTN